MQPNRLRRSDVNLDLIIPIYDVPPSVEFDYERFGHWTKNDTVVMAMLKKDNPRLTTGTGIVLPRNDLTDVFMLGDDKKHFAPPSLFLQEPRTEFLPNGGEMMTISFRPLAKEDVEDIGMYENKEFGLEQMSGGYVKTVFLDRIMRYRLTRVKRVSFSGKGLLPKQITDREKREYPQSRGAIVKLIVEMFKTDGKTLVDGFPKDFLNKYPYKNSKFLNGTATPSGLLKYEWENFKFYDVEHNRGENRLDVVNNALRKPKQKRVRKKKEPPPPSNGGEGSSSGSSSDDDDSQAGSSSAPSQRQVQKILDDRTMFEEKTSNATRRIEEEKRQAEYDEEARTIEQFGADMAKEIKKEMQKLTRRRQAREKKEERKKLEALVRRNEQKAMLREQERQKAGGGGGASSGVMEDVLQTSSEDESDESDDDDEVPLTKEERARRDKQLLELQHPELMNSDDDGGGRSGEKRIVKRRGRRFIDSSDEEGQDGDSSDDENQSKTKKKLDEMLKGLRQQAREVTREAERGLREARGPQAGGQGDGEGGG